MINHIQPSENNCCGCRSCENVCPKNAVEMITDEKGFLYPQINTDKCVDCGLCVKACPIVEKEEQKPDFQQKVYAVINNDKEVLKKSASGGAFSLLANDVLGNGGVVYGCTLDENMAVKHIGVETEEELYKLRGSKYVQSDLKRVFTEILGHLKNDRRVLFTGTPCQVDALNCYLKAKNQSTENLLTADLLCHGVPSPVLWSDFVKHLEKTYKSKMTGFRFRTKIAGWENSVETASFENGKTVKNTGAVRSFLALFYRNISLRPMCFSCKYPSFDRPSDITVGDYWGIDKVHPELNDDKGLSVVIINTQKGAELLKRISNKARIVETQPQNAVQPALARNARPANNREQFWKDYKDNGFDYVVEKYGTRSKASLLKIKLITVLYKMRLLKIVKKFI